jgi:hypothetical protein
LNEDEKSLMNVVKEKKFKSLDDLQSQYIDKLDSLYSEDEKIFGFTVTQKYVILKCQICKNYQMWFTYTGDMHVREKVTNIKFARSIN